MKVNIKNLKKGCEESLLENQWIGVSPRDILTLCDALIEAVYVLNIIKDTNQNFINNAVMDWELVVNTSDSILTSIKSKVEFKMTDKIKKLRDEMAINYWGTDDTPSDDDFKAGFDACWVLHDKLVGPLIEALRSVDTHYVDDDFKCLLCEALEKYKSEVGE